MNYYSLEQSIMQTRYHLVLSANGVALQSTKRIRFSNAPRSKRGKVSGFSVASCRRLRHLLFKVDYSRAVAVTLTKPAWHHRGNSSLMACRRAEIVFAALTKNHTRLPFIKSLIWRKEVQRNGTPHYHCVLIPSDNFDPMDAASQLVEAWIKEVCTPASSSEQFEPGIAGYTHDQLPEQTKKIEKKQLQTISEKMRRAHFNSRKPSIKLFNDSTGYLRYILDHQSKHKDYQAQTTGRAWGVWSRKNLPSSPLDVLDLSEEEFWRLGRVLRKVTRYRVSDDRLPFGWYHTSGRRVQGHGVTDYFSRLSDGSLSSVISRYLKSIREGQAV